MMFYTKRNITEQGFFLEWVPAYFQVHWEGLAQVSNKYNSFSNGNFIVAHYGNSIDMTDGNIFKIICAHP